MSALRILILCISAALICASLRMSHPQIASVVALAAGVAALMLSVEDLGRFSETVALLDEIAGQSGFAQPYMLRICGLAVVAEFASDICRDAGEAALARRIDVGIKIGIAAAALPTAGRILEQIAQLLS